MVEDVDSSLLIATEGLGDNGDDVAEDDSEEGGDGATPAGLASGIVIPSLE
jgi:hypothetical protein